MAAARQLSNQTPAKSRAGRATTAAKPIGLARPEATAVPARKVARPGTSGARYQRPTRASRSEEHTSELQSLMRISYAVFCLKTKKTNNDNVSIYHLNTI